MKGQGTMDTNLKGNPILNLPSNTSQPALVSISKLRKSGHHAKSHHHSIQSVRKHNLNLHVGAVDLDSNMENK